MVDIPHSKPIGEKKIQGGFTYGYREGKECKETHQSGPGLIGNRFFFFGYHPKEDEANSEGNENKTNYGNFDGIRQQSS